MLYVGGNLKPQGQTRNTVALPAGKQAKSFGGCSGRTSTPTITGTTKGNTENGNAWKDIKQLKPRREKPIMSDKPRPYDVNPDCKLDCELLRLIEVGASCFNHYCVGYDVT